MVKLRPQSRKTLGVNNPIVGVALLFAMALTAFAQQRHEDECALTSGMRVYSNASYVEEAGDVIGVELALTVRPDNSVSALLYDYEGVPTNGVPLPGHAAGTTLTLDGVWTQHLEDSSGREIVQTVPVKLRGALDERKFVGTIQVDDGGSEAVLLLRVGAIWGCRANNKPSPSHK